MDFDTENDDEFSLKFNVAPFFLSNLCSSLRADLFQVTLVYTLENVPRIFPREPHDVLDIKKIQNIFSYPSPTLLS